MVHYIRYLLGIIINDSNVHLLGPDFTYLCNGFLFKMLPQNWILYFSWQTKLVQSRSHFFCFKQFQRFIRNLVLVVILVVEPFLFCKPAWCTSHPFIHFLFISWIDGDEWTHHSATYKISFREFLHPMGSSIFLSMTATNNKWSQKMEFFSLELPLRDVEILFSLFYFRPLNRK